MAQGLECLSSDVGQNLRIQEKHVQELKETYQVTTERWEHVIILPQSFRQDRSF